MSWSARVPSRRVRWMVRLIVMRSVRRRGGIGARYRLGMPEGTASDAAAPDAPAVGPPVPDAAEPPRSDDGGWRESIRTGTVTWLTGLALYAAATYFAWLPLQDLAAKAGNPPGGPLGALDT